MSKDEIIKIFDMIKEITDRDDKIRELQQRIDKAIETLNIRSHNKDIVLNMINNLNTMDKALEILKGDSNE